MTRTVPLVIMAVPSSIWRLMTLARLLQSLRWQCLVGALVDSNHVAGWIAERAVTDAPSLIDWFLEDFGSRCGDFGEGRVKVVGAEDGSV